MGDLTFETLQEHTDSLVWRRAEGVVPPERTENWCAGFAAGWNSLARILGRELDPEREVETKPYYDRIIVVGCPDGHEAFVFDEGKGVMGTMRCQCGFEAKCKRWNAEARHDDHRTAEAGKALRADKPAPSEMQQVVE